MRASNDSINVKEQRRWQLPVRGAGAVEYRTFIDVSQQMSVRIVLVGTTHPGNIGAVARAMKNMGLSDLALVRPKKFPPPPKVFRTLSVRMMTSVVCSLLGFGCSFGMAAIRDWV